MHYDILEFILLFIFQEEIFLKIGEVFLHLKLLAKEYIKYLYHIWLCERRNASLREHFRPVPKREKEATFGQPSSSTINKCRVPPPFP